MPSARGRRGPGWPPPRKHRHCYHGVFAPNHKLRRAVTALAIGNIGRRCGPVAGGHAAGRQPTEGCCDTQAKPRLHDTSRIAWAKLLARLGEEFLLECPNCGGDIRLISFVMEPGPIRKILTTLANRSNRRRSLQLAGRPPTGVSLSRFTMTATSFNRRPTSCPRSTSTASDPSRARGINEAARRPDSERLCADGRKTPLQGVSPAFLERLFGARHIGHSAHKPLIRSGKGAEVPLAGLSFGWARSRLGRGGLAGGIVVG